MRSGTGAGSTASMVSVPELAGLRIADARQLIACYLAASPRGGWLPADQAARLLACYQVPMAATLQAAARKRRSRPPRTWAGASR